MFTAPFITVERDGRRIDFKGGNISPALAFLEEKVYNCHIELYDEDSAHVIFPEHYTLTTVRNIWQKLVSFLKRIGFMVNPDPVAFYDPLIRVH